MVSLTHILNCNHKVNNNKRPGLNPLHCFLRQHGLITQEWDKSGCKLAASTKYVSGEI